VNLILEKIEGSPFSLGKDCALCAKLFKRKGDQSKAKENLSKAIDILKECCADEWVEKYEKELVAGFPPPRESGAFP